MSKTEIFLKELCSIPASGNYIDQMQKFLLGYLSKKGQVHIDNLGNILCTFGCGKHFLIDAHYDEIGLIVTDITDNGFVKFDALGGIDSKILPGKEVCIHGSSDINGIISIYPVHLKRGEDKVIEINEMAIDTGLNIEELKNIVSQGNIVTFKRSFTHLINNCISANCIDNRAGVTAVLNSIDKIDTDKVKITVLFSNQEELGIRGAKCFKTESDIEECIVIDTTFALDPYCSKYETGLIAHGSMIGVSPILSRDITNNLINVSKKSNLPYQLEVMSKNTGTNADTLSLSRAGGLKTSLISIPIKYMHTPYEIVNIKDIDTVSNLISSYIIERIKENV